MSAPRCLRAAVETCRPIKISNLALRFPSRSRCAVVRPFSTGTPRCAQDITSGFPMPKEGVRILPDATELKPSPKIVEDVPAPAPAKRTRAPTAEKKLPVQEQKPADVQAAASSDNSARSDLVPPNVLAAYRTPLRHRNTGPGPHYKTADLEMRSYSVHNLEFYADFAVRAAFYLGLEAHGPRPQRKIIERWTMPRSNFVHKKSQENFERITYRRTIAIWNGHQDAVEVWLAFLRKWQFYGVGMKANVWEFETLDAAKTMDKDAAELEKHLEEKLQLFGFNKTVSGDRDLLRLMANQKSRHTGNPMTELREESRMKEDYIR